MLLNRRVCKYYWQVFMLASEYEGPAFFKNATSLSIASCFEFEAKLRDEKRVRSSTTPSVCAKVTGYLWT